MMPSLTAPASCTSRASSSPGRASSRSGAAARRSALILLLCCAAAVSACSAADDLPSGPGPEVPPGAADAAFVSLDALPDVIEAAIADAAERFGVSEDEVAVAGALRVTWSDGALGCPREGILYTQSLVPGYLLTLEIAGDRYEYHGADGRAPFLCER